MAPSHKPRHLRSNAPHPLDKQPGSSSSHGSPHEQLCRHQPQPEDQQVSSRSEASDAPHSATVAGFSAPPVGAHTCSWRMGQCSANAAFAGAGQRLLSNSPGLRGFGGMAVCQGCTSRKGLQKAVLAAARLTLGALRPSGGLSRTTMTCTTAICSRADCQFVASCAAAGRRSTGQCAPMQRSPSTSTSRASTA